MSKAIDITGQKFGNWIVIKKDGIYRSGSFYWLCECQCDNKTQKILAGLDLKRGHTKSCGCLTMLLMQENKKISNRQNIVYDLSGEYGIGYTKNKKPFYFDLEDYDKINNYCWYYSNSSYVSTTINNKDVKMHRLIMDCPSGLSIDHINHKPHDNRKENLRICTHQENMFNRYRNDNKSGVTGVYLHKNNKWIAKIYINGKDIYLGLYEDKNDAIKVRKQAEDKYFKEYRYKDCENN